MSEVLIALIRVEDFTGLQRRDLLPAAFAIVHQDFTAQDYEDFPSFVRVPSIRLVCPVKAHCRPFHLADVQSIPGAFRLEF
jgi:hypothetical protein